MDVIEGEIYVIDVYYKRVHPDDLGGVHPRKVQRHVDDGTPSRMIARANGKSSRGYELFTSINADFPDVNDYDPYPPRVEVVARVDLDKLVFDTA